mmetsp:Transcript_24355/g.48754  ORF Transcript_24355/g.48754 Transcript_24355/m.48754 type:complete len:247 (-) Transcript_24355:51-791(-)
MLPGDKAAPAALCEECCLLWLVAILACCEQPLLALLGRADLLHELGALPALTTTLVELDDANCRLESHRVWTWAAADWFGLDASLLEKNVEVLFALLKQVRLILEKELRDGNLENVRRQLQVHQHVVEVDEVDLLERDELLLDLKQSAHDALECLLDVHPLLRVHALIIRLLELAENLQIPNVQCHVQLDLLFFVLLAELLQRLRRCIRIPEFELIEQLNHRLLPLQIKCHRRHLGWRCSQRCTTV